MKMRGFIIVLAAIMGLLFSSCRGGYTCPTYMNNTQETQIMVKSITESDSTI